MARSLWTIWILTGLLCGCPRALPEQNAPDGVAADIPVEDLHLPDLAPEVPPLPDIPDIVDAVDLFIAPDVQDPVEVTDIPKDLPPHIVDIVYDHQVPDIMKEVVPEVVEPEIVKPEDPCAGECVHHAIQCSEGKQGYWTCLPGDSGCNEWQDPKKCAPQHRCACRGSRWCLVKGPACICVPACQDKACGDDGCEGSCGSCAENALCIEGQCVCQPDCEGKVCGDDGCGGVCGECSGSQDACIEGQCICQPACEGKQCGHDGCNGSCGSCDGNYFCNPDQLCEWVMEMCAEGWCNIPAGEAFLGPESEEICAGVDETRRAVMITRPFMMRQFEITQTDWLTVLGNVGNPAAHPTCGGECPVEQISWLDAVEYANAWSLADGFDECYDVAALEGGDVSVTWPEGQDCNGYRLPTDAEWEYAFRAGRSHAFYNGPITMCNGSDTALNKIAWYGANAGNEPHFYGYKQANGWGLFDMAGNVSEWVWDWHEMPLPEGEFVDPIGPSEGTFRVVRNCSFSDYPKHCRAAYRQAVLPGETKGTVGLRLVRTLIPDPPEDPDPDEQ